jgi:hypothetical protein
MKSIIILSALSLTLTSCSNFKNNSRGLASADKHIVHIRCLHSEEGTLEIYHDKDRGELDGTLQEISSASLGIPVTCDKSKVSKGMSSYSCSNHGRTISFVVKMNDEDKNLIGSYKTRVLAKKSFSKTMSCAFVVH